MASSMDFVDVETIHSEKIKVMYRECNEAVERCFASLRYEQNLYLQKISEISKSLYDVIRQKDLWRDFVNCRNAMKKMLRPRSEEQSDELFEISYHLSKDIMRFYSYADHFSWQFIEKFQSSDYLKGIGIGIKINDFRTHLETTYVSMKKLEDRIEQFAQLRMNPNYR